MPVIASKPAWLPANKAKYRTVAQPSNRVQILDLLRCLAGLPSKAMPWRVISGAAGARGTVEGIDLAIVSTNVDRINREAAVLVPVLEDWDHLTNYAGTAWLLYPSTRFLAAKPRVWIDHVVAGLAL